MVQSTMLQRRVYRSRALRILKDGDCTATQLGAAIGVSRTAAVSIVEGLEAEGWVRVVDPPSGRTRPGRPAKGYSFRAARGYVAGVDIGAHSVRVRIADLRGDNVRSCVRPLDPQADSAIRLDAMESVLRSTCREAGLDLTDLWQVGVATPGTVRDGVVEQYGGQGMPGWIGVDLGYETSTRCGCEAVVGGDSALGAYGELWRGAASAESHVIYVLVGHRVGAGLIIEGRVHVGSRGRAGLIGEHPVLGWHDLESFLMAHPGTATLDDRDQFLGLLARGISAMVLTTDPDVVVVGGSSWPQGDEPVRELSRLIGQSITHPPTVRAGELGVEAVVVGAVRLALDAAEKRYLSTELTATPEPAGKGDRFEAFTPAVW